MFLELLELHLTWFTPKLSPSTQILAFHNMATNHLPVAVASMSAARIGDKMKF